jgi:hypothetical protein
MILLLFTSFVPSGVHAQTTPPVLPSKGDNSWSEASLGNAADQPAIMPADTGLEYVSLKITVAVWADRKGDIVIEQNIRNIGSEPLREFTWNFNFGSNTYDPIRVWDESGALTYTRTETQNGIQVTTRLRSAVQPQQDYRFNVGISVASMVSTQGDSGAARWGVSPGARVQSFVHGVTLPLNATIGSISPPPTSRRQSYVEWRRENSDQGIGIEALYTLNNDIPRTPLFLQKGSPWGTDTYYTWADGTKGETIGKWGCNLTSAAMLINYYSEATGGTFRTNPGQLNSWIRSQGISSVSAIYTAAMSYARANNVPMYMPDNPFVAGDTDANRQRLNTYLRTGNPVILQVRETSSPSGLHFVVAKGVTTAGGRSTYAIHDPVYGAETLVDHYNGTFSQLNLFNSTSPDQRTLMSIVHSPAELVLIDPLGRRTGYDPINKIEYAEIPGAVYVREQITPDSAEGSQAPLEEKYVFVPSPETGTYRLQVIGTGKGKYVVENVATNWNGVLSETQFSGQATVGSKRTQRIEFTGEVGLVEAHLYLPSIRH